MIIVYCNQQRDRWYIYLAMYEKHVDGDGRQVLSGYIVAVGCWMDVGWMMESELPGTFLTLLPR
jgi:hypothetical protein